MVSGALGTAYALCAYDRILPRYLTIRAAFWVRNGRDLCLDAKIVFVKRESDIDGVVGATLEVACHVGEDDASERIALFVEEPCDVIFEVGLFELIDVLFLFFGFIELFEGFVFEDVEAEIDGLCDGIRENFELIEGFFGEL